MAGLRSQLCFNNRAEIAARDSLILSIYRSAACWLLWANYCQLCGAHLIESFILLLFYCQASSLICSQTRAAADISISCSQFCNCNALTLISLIINSIHCRATSRMPVEAQTHRFLQFNLQGCKSRFSWGQATRY